MENFFSILSIIAGFAYNGGVTCFESLDVEKLLNEVDFQFIALFAD